MKKNRFIAGALPVIVGLAMLITSCADVLNPPRTAESDGAEGTLSVRIGGEERTLAPKADALAGLTYKLIINNGDQAAFSGTINPAELNEYTLKAGSSYTVIVEAYDSENTLIASVEKDSIEVKVGKPTSVNLTLVPVLTSDVSGTFTYTFTFPNIGYDSKTIQLKSDSPNSGDIVDFAKEVLDEDEAFYTISGEQVLPPGKYILTLQLTSSRKINNSALEVYREEVVYIYPNLPTDARFDYTEADFTANVRLSGTAVVYDYDAYYSNSQDIVDADYIPRRVYLWNTDNEIAPDEAESQVSSADITKNTETGVYEWELFVPSHDVAMGNLNSVYLSFDAANTTDAAKIVKSGKMNTSLANTQGKTGITLTARTVTMKGLDFDMPGPAGTGAITFVNNDVAVGGWVEFKITTPTNYALLANDAYPVYISNDSFKADPDNIITNADGTISVGMYIPNGIAPSGFKVHASFFHLKGRMGLSAGYPDADGYTPAKIEAFEPVEPAEGETETPAPITIGSAVPAQTSNTNEWTYEIAIPKGYVWRYNASSSEDNYWNYIPLRMTLTSTGTDNPVLTYEKKTNQGVYYPNIINPSDNTATTVGDQSLSVFAVQGVQTEALSENSIRITWEKADWAASGYEVYLYDNVTSPYHFEIASVTADKTSFDYAPAARMIVGNDYSFYVVGRRTDTKDGNQSDWQSGKIKQPKPASFDVTPDTVMDDSDVLFLSSVDLSWSEVNTGNGYIIERSVNGGPWENAYDTYSYSTTSWTDNSPNLARVDATIQYRIKVRDTSNNDSYASEWEAEAPFATPSTSGMTTLLLNTVYDDSITLSGDKMIYYVPNPGYDYLYLSLYDTDNPSYYSPSLDAKFRVYRGGDTSMIDSGDSANSLEMLAYSSAYQPLFIVVEALNDVNTGNYSIRVNN